MKKEIFIGFLLATILLAGCVEEPRQEETVKIGAILPLSGKNAYIGQDMRQGIDSAVEEINSIGGIDNKQLVVMYEDSQGDPKVGISAFNKLKQVQGVDLLVTTLSSVTLALAPLAEESRSPMFTIAVAPSILDAGEYIFINNFNGEQELGVLADFIESRFGYQRLAIIAENTEFSVQYKDVLEKEWQKRNRTVTENQLFGSSATDYKTQLLKIKDSNPEAVYIVAYAPQITRILVQAKELGIEKQMFTYWGAQEKSLIENARDAAEGLIFPSSPFSKETASQFFNKYEVKYGREPHYRAGLAYDIIGIFVEALKKCNFNTANSVCIKDEIYKIKDYPGVTGTTSVTREGGTTKEIVIWQVKNGEFVKYEGG